MTTLPQHPGLWQRHMRNGGAPTRTHPPKAI